MDEAAIFGDLQAVRSKVDAWQASIEARAARARELSARLTGLTATARDRDGLIAVTVNRGGVVTDLRLDDRVRAVPPAQLARAILAVMAGAQALLVDRVREAATETLGADSESARAVVASFAQQLHGVPPEDVDGRR